MAAWLTTLRQCSGVPPELVKFAQAQPSLLDLWNRCPRGDWTGLVGRAWVRRAGFLSRHCRRGGDPRGVFAGADLAPHASASPPLRKTHYAGSCRRRLAGHGLLFREAIAAVVLFGVLFGVTVVAQTIWRVSGRHRARAMTIESAVPVALEMALPATEHGAAMKRFDGAELMRHRFDAPVGPPPST